MQALRRVARAVLPDRERRMIRAAMTGARFGRLAALGVYCGSDKWSQRHRYTPHYQHHLRRRKVRRVLEMGIGGYENPRRGGSSLKMWQWYFPRATVVGLDLHPKAVEGKRICVYQGDQTDPGILEQISREHGPFDFIVDDGSHVNEHVLESFEYLWPHLAVGGVYVIEDLETAYYPNYGGGPPREPGTSVELLKAIIDRINFSYIGDGRREHPLDGEVSGLHVYQGIAFIEKLSALTVEGDRSARSEPT